MNWELLIYLLEFFSIQKMEKNSFQDAQCLIMMEKDLEDIPGMVYVTDHDLPARKLVNALLICTGGCEAKDVKKYSVNYICTRKGTAAEVLNRLLKTQAHLHDLSARLSGARTSQEAVEIACACTGTPYFYFDASYRVLAITGNVDTAGDPEWKHMLEKGFCSPVSIKRMQESGDLDMLADKHDPCLYRASFFPFASLVCNIWMNGRFYSRLNMLGTSKDPDEINKQECRILCSNLLRIAESSGENVNYTGPLNHLLGDLLKGLPISAELIHDRLNLMPQLHSSLLQVGCIDPHSGRDPQLLFYYTSLAERIFAEDDMLILEYEDHIVLLLHAKEADAFTRLHQKLSEFLQAQGLRCAVSNVFHQIGQVRSFYLQALAILSGEYRKGGSVNLVFFQDVYWDHIISLITREQAMAMVSYDIIHLMQLEKNYQFPLSDTLQTYLECACNLQKTAETLFIHKNTALYRINHIRSLLHADLEDAQQRMQLLFSFQILRICSGAGL